ncbi:MAG: PD40 domain-containing protein [Melioribacter sp.]|nr:PD40 domain-containing protein [Melioribacter sp.]
MRNKIILLVLAAGIIFLVTTCDTVENEIDKPNFKGKVVYVTYYEDSPKTELTIMNIDGTNKRAIDTSEKFSISEPSWSKDGKKILYTIALNLLLINSDGTGRLYVDPPRRANTPKFSPNEKFIVYNVEDIAPSRPILYNISDRNEKLLVQTSESCDFGPNPWTNDNQKVLLNAQIERYGNYGLYFVDITTGRIDTIITSPQRLFNRPLLSSDETEIIYSTIFWGASSGYGDLFRLNIKTKETVKLSLSIKNLKIMFPKYWTKDKRYLLFVVDNDDEKRYTSDLLYHDFLTGKTDYLLKNISYDIDIWLEE